VGMLTSAIRTAAISALGAKLARGRSPIVGALIALLLSRALAEKNDEEKPDVPGTEDGLGGLVERFGQGGLEDIIKSWIGPGSNKPIAPNQLHQALGPTQSTALLVKPAWSVTICYRNYRACSPR
jgi:uncharacterized protein YidB (DUF937 family)